MTKLENEPTGPSPLLLGQEKEAWRLLKARFALIDRLEILGKFIGPSYFTKRALEITMSINH